MGLAFTPTRLNDLVVDVALTSVARGDILYRGASKWNNLAPGTAGHVLTSGGAGADPAWAAASGGAPFADTTSIVKGSADATKLLRFEVDGFTTGTTRVLTPPNADATIAGLGVAQTFSAGQTFSSTALFTGSVASPANGVNLGDAGNTPRIVLTNPTSSISLDNNAGNFRIIDGSVKFQYTAASNLIAFALNLSVGNDTSTVPPNSARAWIYHNIAAGTSAANTSVVFEQNTNGTPAAGFGGQLLLRGKSSTTSNQELGAINWVWTTATHASRTSEIRFQTSTNAAALAEVARFDGGGGATPTAGNTGMMLWDVDNATLERVTVGAADSGGTGYKVLRIPN